MSYTDEPAGATPSASTRYPVRKRDAILDARHRYHLSTIHFFSIAETQTLNVQNKTLAGYFFCCRWLRNATANAEARFGQIWPTA